MKTLFPHLDMTQATSTLLQDLTGAVIAYHADADGFCSAAYALTLSCPDTRTYSVTTDQFDFVNLSNNLRQNKRLVMFDINVHSSRGALARLAESGLEQVFVYDDHFGEIVCPHKNVTIRPLLPATNTDTSQIYPASLFLWEVLRAKELDTSRLDFLALSAAYGEGVRHRFQDALPALSRQKERLARSVGRGINAYFSLQPCNDESSQLVQHVVSYLNSGDPGIRAWSHALQAASQTVDRLVAEAVNRASDEPLWMAGNLPIFGAKVDSAAQITNLVASSLRTKRNRGLSMAWRTTGNSTEIEIRRARALSAPNIVAAILSLPSEWFKSRGGHPMAAGCALTNVTIEDFMDALTEQILSQSPAYNAGGPEHSSYA